MMHRERRRHFFIDKPLQIRYMLTITLTLLAITFISLFSLYFGIWGGVLNAFSDEQLRSDLLTASRIQEYEEARHPNPQAGESFSALSFFQQAERLSERQREVFKELLNQTNRRLAPKLLFLLVLIGWGTIFLSHKIAGPLFRFQRVLQDLNKKNLSVRCHLRKFDEAKSVAEAFNHSLTSLDSAVSRLKNIVRENEKDPERLLVRLKEELSKFKTSADR